MHPLLWNVISSYTLFWTILLLAATRPLSSFATFVVVGPTGFQQQQQQQGPSAVSAVVASSSLHHLRQSNHHQQQQSLVICHAAYNKRGGKKKRQAQAVGGSGSKRSKKSKRNNNNNNKQKETSWSSSSSRTASTSTSGVVQLPSIKSRAPPWQVLSTKDAKQNVEREKIRRHRARAQQQHRQGSKQPEDEEHEQEDQQSMSMMFKSKELLSDANRQLLQWKRFSPTSTTGGMTFVGSFLDDKRLPPKLGVPEVAFLGRSNVGKSSLLNKLSSVAKKKNNDDYVTDDKARVGKTPGATASVNLYAMLGHAKKQSNKPPILLGFVDLPGFGYAKLSKDVKDAVQIAAERYLGKRRELALGILLVDARRTPGDDDRAVLAALYDMGVPLVVVATKIDKLARSQVDTSLEIIRDGLGLPRGQPLCVSSITGEGTGELWKIILEACEVHVEEIRDELERIGKNKNDDDDDETKDYGTVPLDDEGNPLSLLFEDGEDLVYDQGFDWVHDSAVMYEGDSEDSFEEDEADDDDFLRNANEEAIFDDGMKYDNKEAFKLKNLKKRVRDMERRGEI